MRNAVISSLSCFVSLVSGQDGVYGATSDVRLLSANLSNTTNTYGSLNRFVTLNVLNFLEYDDCLQLGLCGHAMKHVFDDNVNQLFGFMFDVLLNNVPCYDLYTKWILEDTLNNMASCTYKQIKVNATCINLRNFQHFRFIRGIDANTNLPFLAFAITTDIKYTKQLRRDRYVVAIFNESAIHSVLANNANHSYDGWYACTNSGFDVEAIISLLINGKTYNKFAVENSMWMHLSDGTRNEFHIFHWIRSRKGFLCYSSICILCFIGLFVFVYMLPVSTADFLFPAGVGLYFFNCCYIFVQFMLYYLDCTDSLFHRNRAMPWFVCLLSGVAFMVSRIHETEKAVFCIQMTLFVFLIILRYGI